MNNKPFKVGIYLRLSREDERKGESSSITNQREIIMTYIQKHHLTFIDEYIDDGVSGTQFDRLGWQKLITDIENKRINMVITKDLSRFGRNEGQQLRYLDYFTEYGIRYVAILDNVDTADEYNTANEMIPIQCFFNEKHVRDTSKKMKASVYLKRSQGNFLGSTPPYGYQKDPTNKYKLLIDATAALVVQRIFELFINGTGICQIAQILTTENIPIPSIHKNLNRGLKSKTYGKWTTRTISDILTLPTYMGSLTQGRLKKPSYKSKKIIRQPKTAWIICPNTCPAIISKETFELAQTIYRHNKHQTKKTTPLLLKGLIFCQECGHSISFRTQTVYTKKNGRLTRCYGNCNFWAKHKTDAVCTPHNTKYSELETLILNELNQHFQTLNPTALQYLLKKNDLFSKKIQTLLSQKQHLEATIKLNNKKLTNLYHDKLAEIISLTTYQQFSQDINHALQTNQQELKHLTTKLQLLTTKTSLSEDYSQIVTNFFQTLPNALVIASLIDKITITEDRKITIYYKFTFPNS